MEPHADTMPPVPVEALPAGAWVCDLVYRPLQTRLLEAAAARGLTTIDGLGMLVHQGALAFERWTGSPRACGDTGASRSRSNQRSVNTVSGDFGREDCHETT
jgi:shikimate 5-dehydrogenase